MKEDESFILDQAFLIILVEIIIRQFGVGNKLVIKNFRDALVGAPLKFGLLAYVEPKLGKDLVFELEPIGERVITLGDLLAVEVEAPVGKETVH